MYTQIETEYLFDGKIHIAYLNQPETFNSLNMVLLTELRNFVKSCNAEEKVRCIALSGRGKAFCSGQNLKDALSLESTGEQHVIKKMVTDYYNPLVKEIYESKKPVISLVNGPAVGAGAMLALICDLALATESSYFSQAFVNIGLIPDTGGTYWLPKFLGRQQANYLAFTGKKISASEARDLGLIADYFSDEQFIDKSFQVLELIASQPTMAIGLTKKAFNASYANNLDQQLELEGILQQEAAETEDFKEGVTAFIQKRKPNYRGK